MHLCIPRRALPDIEHLKKQGNIPALIRLLGHEDRNIREHSARILEEFGGAAVPALLAALQSSQVPIRLGVVETLGRIQDERAVQPLAMTLRDDPLTEIRWAAALALGETGSADATPPLVNALRDRNRYVRLGASLALENLDWTPATDGEKVCKYIALQEWDHVRNMGTAAKAPFADMLRDAGPATCPAIATLIGQMKLSFTPETFQPVLTDRSPSVRWWGVMAAMNSGVAAKNLPRMLAQRERAGPNPSVAALLNFLFPGIGYNYLGKWWGFPVFMSYMTIIVLAQLATGPFLPYLVAYPITAVIAAHTYFSVRHAAESP